MYFLGRIIYLIGGIIVTLLGLRLLLALLGANSANGFVSFIYNASLPFARPFFGMFNYTPSYGASHFEMGTLIALVVYAVGTAIVAGFLGADRRHTI